MNDVTLSAHKVVCVKKKKQAEAIWPLYILQGYMPKGWKGGLGECKTKKKKKQTKNNEI